MEVAWFLGSQVFGISGTYKATLAGVLLCCLAYQAFKGPAWLGSSSVAWHIRHLKGPPGWGPSLLLGISGI